MCTEPAIETACACSSGNSSLISDSFIVNTVPTSMPALSRSATGSSSCTPSMLVVYVCVAALGIQAIIQQNVITQMRSELEEMKVTYSIASRKITKISLDAEQQQQKSVAGIGLQGSTQQLEFEIPNYLKLRSPPNMPSVRLTEEEEKKAAMKSLG